MNIWSSVQDAPTGNPNSYRHAVASFTGDVFSTDSTLGTFQVSETGVNRVFPTCLSRPPDAIWRLVFELREPLTLPAGVYFFSNDAMILKEIIIGECNTGVMLYPSAFQDLSDSLAECASGVKNHGQYLKCVSKVLIDAVRAGVITGAQKGGIESCAAQSDTGKK